MKPVNDLTPNPYKSLTAPPESKRSSPIQRESPFGSVVMVVGGLFIFAGSFRPLFQNGLQSLIAAYRLDGRLTCAFLGFYGFVGLLTFVFHLLYLQTGWPKQHLASVYAIGFAVGLTGWAMLIIEGFA